MPPCSPACRHRTSDSRAVTKRGCPINRSLPLFGSQIQALHLKDLKGCDTPWTLEPHTLPWRPYDLSAERLCADWRVARTLQLPQVPHNYRKDNGGATPQPPWKPSRR